MKLQLHKYPSKILTKECRPVKEVNQKVRRLAAAMHWYMLEWKGVGLAAPQVGRDIRMFVINTMSEVDGKKRTIINPEIIEVGDNILMTEGCLSFPGKLLELDRPGTVMLKYLDENGVEKTEEFEGLTARAILHELDHLNGVLFNEN